MQGLWVSWELVAAGVIGTIAGVMIAGEDFVWGGTTAVVAHMLIAWH